MGEFSMTLTFTLYQELQSFIHLFSHPCGFTFISNSFKKVNKVVKLHCLFMKIAFSQSMTFSLFTLTAKHILTGRQSSAP